MNIALHLQGITVVYDTQPAIENIHLAVPENQLIGIVGPNGSGKTTLLKAAMGLVKLSSGSVFIFGHPIEAVRNRIAYVPQRNSVDWDFPINVLETVLLGRLTPRNLFRRVSKSDREIALHSLEQVQLADLARRQISQLSGGQQQRVFIARALAQQADLYFLDEPFAAVDIATENTIITLLKKMQGEGKTIFVVHHDLHSVREYFDYLALINTRLIGAGPTAEVFTAENVNTTYGGRLGFLTSL